MTSKFADAANQFAESFSKAIRDNGDSYYICKGPEWAKDIVMLAHDREFPNDSRYSLIRDAAIAIADNVYDDADKAREDLYDLAVQMIPCYTGELLHWFADHPSRLSDCDAAVEERGEAPESIYDTFSEGYAYAAREVISTIISELEEIAPTLFNPDTDCKLLLSDANGVYIPQMYCQGFSEDDAEDQGIDWQDVLICQAGPDHEHYWDAWQSICDSAEFEQDREMWRLYQNGDLWQVKADVEIPEGWF